MKDVGLGARLQGPWLEPGRGDAAAEPSLWCLLALLPGTYPFLALSSRLSWGEQVTRHCRTCGQPQPTGSPVLGASQQGNWLDNRGGWSEAGSSDWKGCSSPAPYLGFALP